MPYPYGLSCTKKHAEHSLLELFSGSPTFQGTHWILSGFQADNIRMKNFNYSWNSYFFTFFFLYTFNAFCPATMIKKNVSEANKKTVTPVIKHNCSTYNHKLDLTPTSKLPMEKLSFWKADKIGADWISSKRLSRELAPSHINKEFCEVYSLFT